MNDKVVFVVFGGTGDLMKKKLVSAFSSLLYKENLSKESSIIGIARGNFTDEGYKELLIDNAKNDEEKEKIKKLNIKFYRGDASHPETLKNLGALIDSTEIKDKIFYLATSFKLFPDIINELKNQNLNEERYGFSRIVFEKPFGYNFESSAELDNKIKKVFSEEQIFRIDHYVAKETVQNITILKFTNPIFEGLLNNKMVESIELIFDENFGVENRISYYNDVGAIKDMIQSHLLQVLSLILMDRPSKIDAEKIHDEKIKVLKNIEFLNSNSNLIGQYKSYGKEALKYEIKNSRIETFAKILLNCKTERWNRTKLILRTGKKLQDKKSQIIIKFKSFGERSNIMGAKDNKIVIDIFPKQDVRIFMNTRRPGKFLEVEPISFDFCHEEYFGPNTSDEYATLLGEVIRGEKTLFIRSDELNESWKIVDKIESIKDKIPFVVYEDGSDAESI